MFWICVSDFPVILIEGYGRNRTKAKIKIYSSGQGINPQTGGINPLGEMKSIVLEPVGLKCQVRLRELVG